LILHVVRIGKLAIVIDIVVQHQTKLADALETRR
jgi:hypothetical protein